MENGDVKRVYSVESFGYLWKEMKAIIGSITGKLMKGSKEWDVEIEKTCWALLLHVRTVLFSLLRNMEDFVTWTDTSKIRKHVLEYNEEVGSYINR